jgi:hypothetical protein
MNTKAFNFWGFLGCLALTLAFFAAPAQAWFFGDDHPNEKEITRAVEQDLPSWVKVDDLDIGSQEIRSGFMEHSESRVKVIMTPRTDLYRHLRRENDGKAIFRKTQSEGQKYEAFLIARAVAKGEGWNVDIEWDDNNFKSKLGRPSSQLSGDYLISGSDEHNAYLREKTEKFEAVKANYEAPLKGNVHCKGHSFEIDKLQFDIKNETGTIRYRPVSFQDYEWKEDVVTLKPRRAEHDYGWNTPVLRGYFDMTIEDGAIEFQNHDCEVISLLPANSADLAWKDARAEQKAFLDSLKPGPIASQVREGDNLYEAKAKVLSVNDRGFKVELQHPMRLNGKVNSNTYVTTAMDVRFTDAPLTIRTHGKTTGRGDPIITNMCHTRGILTPEGDLRIEAHTIYGCNEVLELMP